MKIEAYPQMRHYDLLMKEPNLKYWSETAKQISVYSRAYPGFTHKEILYHFTQDWEYAERSKFKRWYSWTQQGQKNKEYNKKAGDLGMRKVFALDFASDKQKEYDTIKGQFQSRINSAEKLLDKLLNKKLIDINSGRKMGRILHMLKEEIRVLQSMEILKARIDRAAKILKNSNFEEGAYLLKNAQIESSPDGTEPVMKKIKNVINSLNYDKYLDQVYEIRADLVNLGRHGEAEMVTRVIREDLVGLEKPAKRLSEIYTALARAPRVISKEEDKKFEKEKPVDIEVEEPESKLQEPKIEKPKPQPEVSTPVPMEKKRIPNI